jgi:hypothetical protein
MDKKLFFGVFRQLLFLIGLKKSNILIINLNNE